uniref:Uncharacterized protein n=1 Tax=Rhabditophanes sp. KR3021 TaxID=114890 RepID=A0AC35TJ72_9BILA
MSPTFNLNTYHFNERIFYAENIADINVHVTLFLLIGIILFCLGMCIGCWCVFGAQDVQADDITSENSGRCPTKSTRTSTTAGQTVKSTATTKKQMIPTELASNDCSYHEGSTLEYINNTSVNLNVGGKKK